MAVYRGTADQLAFDRALQTVGLSERNMQVINLDWERRESRAGRRSRGCGMGGVSLLRCAAIRLTWW
ncbi:Uncharacterised protein [Raoultella planticola]|uniref:Uncharacterized protein n=1 Tax=Raoultella planticola TaxID=575 RepID=A0A485B6A4_RAOPL|nr:Uncharacterised protein [Raoultella planticola]